MGIIYRLAIDKALKGRLSLINIMLSHVHKSEMWDAIEDESGSFLQKVNEERA